MDSLLWIGRYVSVFVVSVGGWMRDCVNVDACLCALECVCEMESVCTYV